MRKYYIKTYGCQMNVADSERLAGVLESAGYQEAADEKQADLILVNTCVVRQGAEDRAAGYAFTAKGLREKKLHLKIGLCGCIVTRPGIDVKKQFPHIDFFIPPNSPDILIKHINSSLVPPSADHSSLKRSGITAWVTIMHGCDNFCSYCIVPYVRGREHSRPITEILEEIKQIDFNQYKEIYLLGQNVNSYKYGLANLLKKICEEPRRPPCRAGEAGLVSGSEQRIRVRFMTSHPRDMSDDIINAVAELPSVCEFFHLPIQHGSDRILKSMNRGYTIDDYRKLIDKVRAKIPNAAITSDVIVGYPGETDEDFRLTLYIIEQIGFDACNTLAYSTRPGTAAGKLPDDVPQKVKQARLQEVMGVVGKVAQKKNEKLIGSVQGVLVDNVASDPRIGRTRGNKIVKFSSKRNDLLGQLVSVKIKSAKSWLLKGELINGKF